MTDSEPDSSTEFVQQPTDLLLAPGTKLPAQIKCSVKNAIQVYMECNNKVREDIRRNVSKKANFKYETLTLTIKRREYDFVSLPTTSTNSLQLNENNNNLNKKLVCKCIAYNQFNQKIISNRAIIKNAYLEEDFQTEPMDEVSYEGDTIEMRCDPPKGEPAPVVYWLKNNQEIDTLSDSSRFKLSNDYSLLIMASKKEDAGSYSCVASNLANKRISKPAKLTMLDLTKKYSWSDWSEWSKCSSIKCDDNGIMKRTRSCQTTNKMSQILTVSINMCDMHGVSFEDQPCTVPCSKSVNSNKKSGEWSEWSPWSACSNECKQFRRRYCENVSENDCTGEKVNIKSCVNVNSNHKSCKTSNERLNHHHHNNHHNHNQQQSQEISDKSEALKKSYINSGSGTTAPPVSSSISSFSSNSVNNLIKNNVDLTMHSSSIELKLDKSFLLKFAGICGGLVLLISFLIFLFVLFNYVIKRRSNKHGTNNRNSKYNRELRASDLNLYYTCEKLPSSGSSGSDTISCSGGGSSGGVPGNGSGIDDECSIFMKYSKAGSSSCTSSTSSSSASSTHDNKSTTAILLTPGINKSNHHNSENKHLLINNIQKQRYLNSIETHDLVIAPNTTSPNKLTNQIINSPFKSCLNSTPNQTCGSTSSSNSSSKNTPATKSIILSTSSPLSNIYYATPNLCHQTNEKYKIVSINNVATLIPALTLQQNYSNAQANEYRQIDQDDDEELAYDVSDTLLVKRNNELMNNLNNLMDLKDVCVGRVNSSGGRFTLDCGINLIVPEGAIAKDQHIEMYLGLCRNDSHKPKLNEKNTFLSEIITIGPVGLTLLKPVILVVDHCARNMNKDWNVTLYSSFNSNDCAPDWHEEQNITSDFNTNLNLFLNATDDYFLLMTDKLGRYSITGESKCHLSICNQSSLNGNVDFSIPQSVAASKYLRLVTFFSSSINNNEFNMRIYFIDNLIWALQEVLRDEKKIGGTILNASEPFLISHSNINESLKICIDDLNINSFNCKYNVNCQEVPLNHIWNGRNNLLHCSFTFERNKNGTQLTNNHEDRFSCIIRAFKQSNLNIAVNINYNLSNESNSSDSLRLLEFCLNNWNCSTITSRQLINPFNSFKSLYFKVDKNLKKQLCKILDNTYNHSEKNWRTLAQYLEINRNLHYFASKSSPTEMLLLYFEAINDIKKQQAATNTISPNIIVKSVNNKQQALYNSQTGCFNNSNISTTTTPISNLDFSNNLFQEFLINYLNK